MGKVLLTGANGFIATHVLIRFLQAGHTVVGTVRSNEKAEEALRTIPEDLRSKVKFAIVPDIAAPGAFDQVIKDNDVDAVVHTATPFRYDVSPEELFNPAVHGAQNVLESAHQHGHNITRIIVLSSCAAVYNPFKGNWPEKTFTEEDWNPITKEQALSGHIGLAYYGAKTHSEKAAWDFQKAKNPKFSIVSLNPPFVFGPIAKPVTAVKDIATSNSELWGLIDGSRKGGEIPPSVVWAWVDVRDVAEAHLRAYEQKEAANQRFIISAGNYNNKHFVDGFKTFLDQPHVENLPTKLSEGLGPDGYPEGGIFGVDSTKSQKILGMKYRSVDEMLKGFVESAKPVLA